MLLKQKKAKCFTYFSLLNINLSDEALFKNAFL